MHPWRRDGLGANIAKVGGLVKIASSVKEEELGGRITRVDGLLQIAKGGEEGWEDGHLLLTLDRFILEVGGLEGCMLAMSVLVVINVVLVAASLVTTPGGAREGCS